jgi:hypothetical protein
MLYSYNFPSDNCWPEADPGFVGPESYTVLGALFKKKIQNYEYKIRYVSEYLFRAPPRVLQVRGPEASASLASR